MPPMVLSLSQQPAGLREWCMVSRHHYPSYAAGDAQCIIVMSIALHGACRQDCPMGAPWPTEGIIALGANDKVL